MSHPSPVVLPLRASFHSRTRMTASSYTVVGFGFRLFSVSLRVSVFASLVIVVDGVRIDRSLLDIWPVATTWLTVMLGGARG